MKTTFGFFALVVGIIPFFPYLRDIFARKTEPHLYSWFVWSVLQTTGVIAMIVGGAGIGALGLAAGVFFVVVIFLLSFNYGTKDITRFDTLCLAGALGAIALWIIQKDPLYSVMLVSLTDFIAFLPTYRKGYAAPRSETISAYALWALSDFFGILALASYSVVSTLYIASLLVTNSVCVFVLLAGGRRSKRMEETTQAL